MHVIEMTPKYERPADRRRGTFYDMLKNPANYAILSTKKLPKVTILGFIELFK